VSSWKAILAAVVIFGAGLVTGAAWIKLSASKSTTVASAPKPNGNATTNAAARKPLSLEHLKKVQLMGRVQRELDLTPEQHERIDKIITDGQERIRDLWDQVAPEIQDELDDVQTRLCKELTPEQHKRFDELMKASKNKPAATGTSTNAPAPADRK
jgi:Spy/CpxP family protein refolding chaperone